MAANASDEAQSPLWVEKNQSSTPKNVANAQRLATVFADSKWQQRNGAVAPWRDAKRPKQETPQTLAGARARAPKSDLGNLPYLLQGLGLPGGAREDRMIPVEKGFQKKKKPSEIDFFFVRNQSRELCSQPALRIGVQRHWSSTNEILPSPTHPPTYVVGAKTVLVANCSAERIDPPPACVKGRSLLPPGQFNPIIHLNALPPKKK